MREMISGGKMVISLRTNAVYQPRVPLEEPVYAYIRECTQSEIGFSVLDVIAGEPDFSNCGMFWLSPQDFDEFFEEV